MPLPSGTKLGPYEIERPLGAGGMGEVYLAADGRLGRQVAIKILSSDPGGDNQFRERFEREARTLSRLNHRHICTLHDVGHDAGTSFLVMEYLEGETLAARLARAGTHGTPTGFPLNEAIQISIQMASALDAAHRLGITHRDLKPANVMLTKAGIKLLDFGLAKTQPAVVASTQDSTALTVTAPPADAPLTAAGTILGTWQYMAPEQVEGLATDARTDIFALGAVIYEMVTGRKAFHGRTPASLVSAILKDQPPAMTEIVAVAPAALNFLVTKCLAKDPDDRWQSARDVKDQLEWIAESGARSVAVPARSETGSSRSRMVAWTTAAAMVFAGMALIGWSLSQRRGDSVPDVRFDITTPNADPFGLALSPNGRFLTFIAQSPSNDRNIVWLRRLGDLTAQPIAGSEGAYGVFWSPDSQDIGFVADRKVRRVSMSGGMPRTVCDLETAEFSGATWGPDDTIVFSTTDALRRVSANGGAVSTVTAVDKARGEVYHVFPLFLRDGKHLLYGVQSTLPADTGTYVQELGSTSRTRVIDTVSMTAYAHPGFLIYQRAGALLAIPFDETRLTTSGSATRIVANVNSNPYSGAATFAVASSGMLAYRSGFTVRSQLTWFDRAGKRLEQVAQPGMFWSLALSPDERRIAATRADPDLGRSDVWTVELSSGVTTRVTFDPGNDDDPAWTSDGSALTFWSDRTGRYGIYRKVLGGSTETVIYQSTTPTYLGGWSTDGRFLLFHDVQSLFALPVANAQEPRQLVHSSAIKDEPHFSPDGRWVAYSSNESGITEVYVAPFPAFDKATRVSVGGGGVPWWRADTKELFYMSADGMIMSVPVTPGVNAEFGTPQRLFQTPISSPIMISAQYVATRDGQRFLVAVPPGITNTPITAVLDWTRLLSR